MKRLQELIEEYMNESARLFLGSWQKDKWKKANKQRVAENWNNYPPLFFSLMLTRIK